MFGLFDKPKKIVTVEGVVRRIGPKMADGEYQVFRYVLVLERREGVLDLFMGRNAQYREIGQGLALAAPGDTISFDAELHENGAYGVLRFTNRTFSA